MKDVEWWNMQPLVDWSIWELKLESRDRGMPASLGQLYPSTCRSTDIVMILIWSHVHMLSCFKLCRIDMGLLCLCAWLPLETTKNKPLGHRWHVHVFNCIDLYTYTGHLMVLLLLLHEQWLSFMTWKITKFGTSLLTSLSLSLYQYVCVRVCVCVCNEYQCVVTGMVWGR